MSDYYDTFGSADASQVIDAYSSPKAMKEEALYQARKQELELRAAIKLKEEIGESEYNNLKVEGKLKSRIQLRGYMLELEEDYEDQYEEEINFDSFKDAISHLKNVEYGFVKRNNVNGFSWYPS